jgi:hypothetical protein
LAKVDFSKIGVTLEDDSTKVGKDCVFHAHCTLHTTSAGSITHHSLR